MRKITFIVIAMFGFFFYPAKAAVTPVSGWLFYPVENNMEIPISGAVTVIVSGKDDITVSAMFVPEDNEFVRSECTGKQKSI